MIFIKKILIIIRKIFGFFLMFFGLVGFSLSTYKGIDFFMLFIFLIIGYFIYGNFKEDLQKFIKTLKYLFTTNGYKKPLTKKEKLLKKINKIQEELEIIKNTKTIQIKEEIIEEKNENQEEYSTIDDYNIHFEYSTNYDYKDYSSFKSENGETFQVDEERGNKNTDTFWEKVYSSYKEITIKLEEVKQYGNINTMQEFEKDLHIFFNDRVLQEALEKGLIDKIKADKKRPKFSENSRYYSYYGRTLSEEEFNEAKRLFDLEQKFYLKSTKRSIYDLYCKSLRRIGNFYKKYKEWELALSIFMKIKDFGFEGIMDGKSIIKCKKEIDLKNQKLLKNEKNI